MGGLTFDGGLFVWTLITFGIMAALLAKFAFKPMRRILAEREQSIRSALEEAEKARAEATRMLALNEERLAEARTEARRIIDDGHRIVAEMKKKADAAATEASSRRVNETRAEIEREVKKSLDDLKTTVANLSLRIAGQVIREGMNETRHIELADSFIEQLKKTHARPTS